MPITKSAKKALKVSLRRQGENLLIKHQMKDKIKGLKIVLGAKKADATTELASAYTALDKAAKKHFIHKNKASRLKSRLAKAANKAGSKIDAKMTEKATSKPVAKAKKSPIKKVVKK